MITVTEHPVNLLMELKRLLEIFIRGGSLTATHDRLNDLELTAIDLLHGEGFCFIDTTYIEEIKARDLITVNTNKEARAKGEGKSDDEIKLFSELASVDDGDINGRYRFNSERLADSGLLIAGIMQHVKPKTAA